MTSQAAFADDMVQGSPFVDYTISGLALAIIVGGSMLLAAATIFTGHEVGVPASGFAGLAMMIFEIAEIAVVDRFAGSWLLVALSLQASSSHAAWPSSCWLPLCGWPNFAAGTSRSGTSVTPDGKGWFYGGGRAQLGSDSPIIATL
ncbi:MAG TPA: hypothetical protein VKB35_16485 [Ktedonobacteraceae bacterium]|nr:hypothetical protein [Ktedonobacteraceae bacterium]